MDQRIREIAERIKELREIMGISEVEMAEQTSTTLSEYRALESGETDFNFTFIFKCAQRFHVDITDLLQGSSPTLSTYSVTRQGQGLPIVRRQGFHYQNLAPLFKHKMAEPFLVQAVYAEEEQNKPVPLSTHVGQEVDIILKGSLKTQVGDHVEVISQGDTIYYDSATPHGMIATGGSDCEFIAVVIHGADGPSDYQPMETKAVESAVRPEDEDKDFVYHNYVDTKTDENGVLTDVQFKDLSSFNFAYDIVDAVAAKSPNKLAMLHLDKHKNVRRFTFEDMSRYSSMTANYFQSLGIKKGDRVMLVLKRHYQFWYAILALHKLGAVAIPATNLLVEHDFDYRFNAAGVSAIVCTADGDVAHQVDLAAKRSKTLQTKVLVGGSREGWHDFDQELGQFSSVFHRPAGEAYAGGDDPMLMFFTSGTTGYPKIAAHNFKYAMGHFITAKYWHKVNPNGLHFTISDTGWGKALWGKLYGQWLCEAATFTYDFDKFDADDILPLFKQFHITTFCAPPTMYRFFIKEDLSKYDLSTLEHATVAGEALNAEVFQQFYKATGLKLMEGFGQTETTLTICNLVGTTPKPGSMGKPSPMYEVDLLNGAGESAKVGEVGEIVIRVDQGRPCGLFSGYYRDPEKTAEAWENGCYHTGDTAWRDEDGYFWYNGRIDDLIKSSGYRIGPFEIESVLMELPYVLECAVTAAPDEIRGQVVKATIVLTKGTVGTDALKKEIQTYVKEHTAPYKYPRIVEFMEELPKTISGKIRRVELRQQDQ